MGVADVYNCVHYMFILALRVAFFQIFFGTQLHTWYRQHSTDGARVGSQMLFMV